MARLRRERDWVVPNARVEDVQGKARDFLQARDVRIVSENANVLGGKGGSALKAFAVWTQKTAPYRVRVEIWEEDGAATVHAIFEESTQFGKAGPAKETTYTKLGDSFLSDLRAATVSRTSAY